MPKPDGGPGQTGIRSDGAVMNGQMSTKDAFCGETGLLLQQQLRQWGPRVAQFGTLSFASTCGSMSRADGGLVAFGHPSGKRRTGPRG